jgi:hypothetical protein
LLLEQWMTPSIFAEFNVGTIAGKVYDEWTVAQYVDRNVAKEILERWATLSEDVFLVRLETSFLILFSMKKLVVTSLERDRSLVLDFLTDSLFNSN